jgi:hypothetical protein
MKKPIINQMQAIDLLKREVALDSYEIKFDATPVEALDAFLLRKNGVLIPDNLVYYDDDAIDFSDDPDLTDEDLATSKIKWLVRAELSLDEEVKVWIHEERINLDELLSNLVTAFYKNVKSIPKKGERASGPLSL